MILDENSVISNTTSGREMKDMLESMREVFDRLPLNGAERQKYGAALRYAEEALRF